MRIDRDGPPSGPVIRGLGVHGYLLETGYHPALLLTASAAMNWEPPALDALDEAALAPILDPAPEFVVIGTGARLRLPPRALFRALEARNIGVEAMDSRAAARAWGVIRGEGRVIAAALYPLDAA
jgi:uncharacterized protein